MSDELGITVVCVPVRVDVTNTRALIDPVREQIMAGKRAFVMDLRETQMIDSTALGALVQLFKSLTAQGGSLVLAEVGDAVARVLSITRLDTVFSIVNSRKEAIASLARL